MSARGPTLPTLSACNSAADPQHRPRLRRLEGGVRQVRALPRGARRALLPGPAPGRRRARRPGHPGLRRRGRGGRVPRPARADPGARRSRGPSSSATRGPCCSRTSAGSPGRRARARTSPEELNTRQSGRRSGILIAATSEQGGSIHEERVPDSRHHHRRRGRHPGHGDGLRRRRARHLGRRGRRARQGGASRPRTSSFTGVGGFIVHGINGMMIIPLLGLALLVVSFFAKVPGGVKVAAIVLGAIVVQVFLGIFGHESAYIGALHGLNAFILFGSAVYAARLARTADAETPSTPSLRDPGRSQQPSDRSSPPPGPLAADRRDRGGAGHRRAAGLDVAGQPDAGGVLGHGHGVRRRRRRPRCRRRRSPRRPRGHWSASPTWSRTPTGPPTWWSS